MQAVNANKEKTPEDVRGIMFAIDQLEDTAFSAHSKISSAVLFLIFLLLCATTFIMIGVYLIYSSSNFLSFYPMCALLLMIIAVLGVGEYIRDNVIRKNRFLVRKLSYSKGESHIIERSSFLFFKNQPKRIDIGLIQHILIQKEKVDDTSPFYSVILVTDSTLVNMCFYFNNSATQAKNIAEKLHQVLNKPVKRETISR